MGQPDYDILKPAVKTMYMQGSSAPEISLIFRDVPISTIYSWITTGGWKKERESGELNMINAPRILLKKFVDLLNKLDESDSIEDLRKNADAVSKYASAYAIVFKKTNPLEDALWFFKDFGTFLRDSNNGIVTDSEFFEKLDTVLQKYQRYLIIKYSPKNVGG